MTSEYEGFGLVLLEAIYAKLPIVAMDVSSIKEIIGRCGEVSKFGDLRIFVKNVFKVLNNRDTYNLENYLDKFSMGINFEKYYEIYQKCN